MGGDTFPTSSSQPPPHAAQDPIAPEDNKVESKREVSSSCSNECRALILHPSALQDRVTANAAYEYTGIGTGGGSTEGGGASKDGGVDRWGSDYGTRRGNHGFVGLSNQGATCYMNSLLQTLYMTPEFRSALYQWKYAGATDEDGDCIPLQLQRLFGLLQLSSRGSVETTALTKSFGWSSSDGFQQHDVQELCRVLFDALERVLAGTDHATLVNDLYQGTMIDYVLCQECKNETRKEDVFLDLSLVLRPFGSKAVMNSVVDSLEFFLKPETLEGDNQYFCEKCQKKCNAVKGLKFQKLPFLLSLQLKRFDYDMTTWQRIKLNDEVRFPLILDMNRFLPNQPDKDGDNDWVSVDPMDVAELLGGDVGLPDLVDAKGNLSPDQQKEQEEASMGEEERSFHMKIDPQKLIKERGPWIYELYAVLIHSGSALGGHYYAYIRPLDGNDGQWYNFNDSTVSKIDVATVMQAWGGKWSDWGTKKTYKTTGWSGANAYMLMYRKVEPGRGAVFPSNDEVPLHVKEDVQKEEVKAKEEKEKMNERMNSISIYCVSADHTDPVRVDANKKDTLRALREKLYKALGMDQKGVLLENVRLREMDTNMYRSYAPKEKPLTDDDATVEQLRLEYRRVYVELRMPGEDWPTINFNDIQVEVIMYDADQGVMMKPKQVFVNKNATVGELREQVSKLFGADVSRLRLAREQPGHFEYYNKMMATLDDDSLKLSRDLNILDKHKFYAEVKEVEEDEPVVVETSGNQTERPKKIDRIQVALNNAVNALTIRVVQAEFTRSTKLGLGLYQMNQLGEKVELVVDRRSTLADLRSKLSKTFNLEPQSFKIMQRPGTTPPKELKGDKALLSQCSIFTNTDVFVVAGEPLAEGEFTFRFYHFQGRCPPNLHCQGSVVRCLKCGGKEDDDDDGELVKVEVNDGSPNWQKETRDSEGDEGHHEHKHLEADGATKDNDFGQILVETPTTKTDDYKEVLSLVVTSTMTVMDVRVQLTHELKLRNFLPASAKPDCVRIRERILNKMGGRVLKNHEKVSTLVNRDDTKELAFQVLEEPEVLPSENSTLVVLQWWCRKCWSLGPKYEFLTTMSDGALKTTERMATEAGVDPANLRVLNVYAVSKIFLSDLHLDCPGSTLSWSPATQFRSCLDGDFFLLQDSSEPLRELTPEEQASMKARKENASTTSTTTLDYGGYYPYNNSTSNSYGNKGWSSYKRGPEKGLTILTKEEREKKLKEEQEKTQEAAAAANPIRSTAPLPSSDESKEAQGGGGGMALFDDMD